MKDLKAKSYKLKAQHKGLLFSFDGLDSSGKATQTARLAERLRYNGRTVHVFQTPDYSTKSGQELKLRLQNKSGNWHQTPWEDKMALFATNRAEHRDEVLAALKGGDIVIYDRYVPSSLAFITVEALEPQMVELWRADIHRTVQRLEYRKNEMPPEDASLFLDVPPDIAARLLEHRKEKLQDEDEYTDHIRVQQRLYNEYDFLATNDPQRYIRIKCVAESRLLGTDEVEELVWEALTHRFPQLKR